MAGIAVAATCEGNRPGCTSCDDLKPTSCNMCAAGHHLTFTGFDGACSPCAAGKGRAADTEAQTGDTVCDVDCAGGCLFCGGTAQVCLGCKAGYSFAKAASTCSVCPTGKGKAADTNIQTEDTTCDVNCSSEACLTCGSTPDECLACKAGFKYTFATKTCSSCLSGKGNAADTAPRSEDSDCSVNCDPNCAFCSASSSQCVGCSEGYQLNIGTNTCSICSSGTGRAGDTQAQTQDTTCGITCSSQGCNTCGSTATKCLGCKASFSYIKSSSTCSPCSLGSGRGADLTLPTEDTSCTVTCSGDCLFCGDTADKCFGCKASYRLSLSDTKCKLCENGKGKAADTSPQTQDTTCDLSCNPECGACTPDLSSCLSCRAGYKAIFVDGKMVCVICAGGTGKAADSAPPTQEGICNIECDIGCESCTENRTYCISCSAGFYKKAEGSCAYCPAGTGKPVDTEPTIPSVTGGVAECLAVCHPTCRYCRGNSATDCLNCAASYYSDGAGTCNACPDTAPRYQDSVIVKYTYLSSNCNLSCDNSCASCRAPGSGNCKKCNAGFYWSTPIGNCMACPLGTGRPTDLQDRSLTTTSTATECNVPCADNCKHCSGPANNQCLSCYRGYFKNSSGQCQICPDGTGKGNDSEVNRPSGMTCLVKCNPACNVCYGGGSTNCLNCGAGYYLSAPGICSLCPDGYSKLKDTGVVSTQPSSVCSVKCHYSCRWCTSNSATACIACSGGFFWVGGGTCKTCDNTKGTPAQSGPAPLKGSTSKKSCTITCHPNCLTCSGEGPNDCVRCVAGFYLSAPGVCSICPKGKGKLADTVPQAISTSNGQAECTISCNQTCRTCSGTASTQCVNCAVGYFYAGKGTCTVCETGKGKPADTIAMAKGTTSADACTATCDQACARCFGSSPSECVRCSAGHFLSATDTCTMCPTQKGKLADTLDPSPIANGYSACGVSCDATCRTCRATGATNCLNCAAGYFFAGKGKCTICETGKGKPADTVVYKDGLTSAAACTITCSEACTNCYEEAPSACRLCNAGFYKSATDTCTMCPQGRGKVADVSVVGAGAANTLCDLSCDAASNCRTCDSSAAGSCLNCRGGFFWIGDGKCTVCDNGKSKNPDETLMSAPTTQDAVCTIPCDKSCQICQGASDNCILCADGFYWKGNGKCEACNPGRGKPADISTPASAQTESQACKNCHESCLGCSNQGETDCIKCRAAMFLTSAGKCELCPGGKGKTADQDPVPRSISVGISECSISCNDACRNCEGPEANNCVTCRAGIFYQGSGVCTACEIGKGKPDDTTLPAATTSNAACQTCDSSCYTCKGTTKSDCLLCQAGHYLSAAGTCTMCPLGSGKPKDETIQEASQATAQCTTKCHPSCRTCKGPAAEDCLNCHAGFWWAGNGVCTQCDPGQGIPESSGLENIPGAKENCQVKCNEACLTCSDTGANKCVKCAAGFFLSAANTCTMCPAGKGKPADIEMPTVSEDEGDTQCSATCPPGCRTCDQTNSLICLNCMEAHYFSAPGTCTKCTAGTGKPRDTVLVKDPQQPEICKTCHASCVYCKGEAATDCLNCNEGFFMKTANTCSMCPIGHGKVADVDFPVEPIPNTDGTGECNLKCHQSCRTCKGTSQTECLNCNGAFFHSAPGECSACLVKTGKPVDDRIIPPEEAQTQDACTAQCHSSCNWCTGNTESKCLSCVAGFFKSDEGVCSICPEKTGKLVDPAVFSPKTTEDAACTLQCIYPCLNCAGPATTDCLTCTEGHFMPTAGTCALCPFGTGKLKDSQLAVPSSTDGKDECKVSCNPRCSSCSTTEENTCVGCSGGFFWDLGVCKNCPVGTSKPAADTTGFTVAQTSDTCSLNCHRSCQMCSGPGESDCLNCNSGFWWAGEGKCTQCSDGRGKLKDVQLFPDAPSFPDSCQIYCDVCDSGCLTCGEDPFSCTSCVVGRYLAANKTCTLCTDYCVECSNGDSCDRCAVNFKLSNDSKTCLGDCLVENCSVCAVDRSKCTKCNDEYVLKSETECVMDYGNAVEDLSQISIEESPRVDMNILQNALLLNLPATESQTITSVKVEDKIAEKLYTCEELSCSYTKTNEGIKFEFNPDFSITDGKLIIERGGVTTKSIRSALTPNNRRMLQSLRNYPIVIDNISLMGQSRLKSFGFAMRVIVGILRLPLSLALFWKYPHFAMLMDHMVTHLRVYSLFGKPYMAYVEVVFQSVSESRVLPFNFANPFEHWNPSTLQCTGFTGIRSKNLNCSWFDNYGENFIGLLSVALLALILVKTGRYLSTKPDLLPWQKQVLAVVERDYGLKFVISKIDANHLEIITMTLIAYCTADSSSKSVIGIMVSTIGLIAMAYLGGVLTQESLRIYQAKPGSRPASVAGHPANNKLQLIIDTHSSRSARPPSVASLHPQTPATQQLIPEDLAVAESAQFVFDRSTFPATAWSHYFLAARYVRALLLAVFATTVRSSVEQVVLSVLLESAYLAVLILFDFRGTRLERLFYTGVHSLMLLHLILRAVATSSGLSDRDVQLVVATMIVVVLVAYIFVHVLAALWLAGTLFGQTHSHSAKAPEPHHVTKMQVLESEADLAAEQDALSLPQGRPFFEELPAAVPTHATHPVAFPSYIDQDIPQEFLPDQQDIPDEKSRQVHVGQIDVAVRADRPTQPRSFGQADQF